MSEPVGAASGRTTARAATPSDSESPGFLLTLLPEHQPLLPGPVLAARPLQALQRPRTETINMIFENNRFIASNYR